MCRSKYVRGSAGGPTSRKLARKSVSQAVSVQYVARVLEYSSGALYRTRCRRSGKALAVMAGLCRQTFPRFCSIFLLEQSLMNPPSGCSCENVDTQLSPLRCCDIGLWRIHVRLIVIKCYSHGCRRRSSAIILALLSQLFS